jgi:hypothetical protein
MRECVDGGKEEWALDLWVLWRGIDEMRGVDHGYVRVVRVGIGGIQASGTESVVT